MSQRQLRMVIPSLACTSLLLFASSVAAQDALGGGNALDRNLGIGTGGQNAARPANPFAGRNAVITGEVVSGREFRGRVGYTAPGDFRGSTPVNDLYRFRANSALSNAAVFSGLGSSTFDQLRFGQGLGVLELQRSSAAATPLSVVQSPSPLSYSQLAESRLQFDSVMLNAATGIKQANAAQPTTLRTARTVEGQPIEITSSSVRGLSMEGIDPNLERMGLSTYDEARLRDELSRVPDLPGAEPKDASETERQPNAANRVGAPFETRFADLRAEPRVAGEADAAARVDGSQQAEYNRVLQRIVDRYARNENRSVEIDPALLKRIDEQFGALRGQLSGSQTPSQIDPATGRPLPSSGAPTAAATPGSVSQSPVPGQVNPNDPRDQRDPRDPRTVPGQRDPARPNDPLADPTKPADDAKPEPVDMTQLGAALRHGEKIERLSSEDQGRFNELMNGAEEHLKKGDYMLAEQRFQRALRFLPGHPLAMAGAANAQLGAGLYLSSALTLRTLFTQHPEMIDATYAEGLLPAPQRLEASVTALRSRLEQPADRAAHAFLLAYIARQTGDRVMLEEGMSVMQREAPNDPLVPLLQTVWLEGGKAPATPDPAK